MNGVWIVVHAFVSPPHCVGGGLTNECSVDCNKKAYKLLKLAFRTAEGIFGTAEGVFWNIQCWSPFWPNYDFTALVEIH